MSKPSTKTLLGFVPVDGSWDQSDESVLEAESVAGQGGMWHFAVDEPVTIILEPGKVYSAYLLDESVGSWELGRFDIRVWNKNVMMVD